MNKKNNKQLDRVSTISLSEKQSTRTTLKLSDISSNAFDWLIKTNNLKPKEVFDLICSNESIVDWAIEVAKKSEKSNSVKHTRKTFVISKQALRLLNKYSKKHQLSRDLLAESLVVCFKGLLEEHAKKEKQLEEKARTIISDFWSKAESVEKQLKDLLYNDSPILDRFGYVVVLLMNLTSAIESKLSNGVPIDPDDFSQS